MVEESEEWFMEEQIEVFFYIVISILFVGLEVEQKKKINSDVVMDEEDLVQKSIVGFGVL